MKKAVSIVMAFLLLLSVINLSVVSHLCQGKVVATRIALAGQHNPSCGMMEGTDESSLPGPVFKKHCCENESAPLKVDRSYSPSYNKNLTVFQQEIAPSLFLLPEMAGIIPLLKNHYQSLSPPGAVPKHTVELAEICVFRI